jgi:uncharacterized ubiquitin-like protein YukD
MNTQTTPELQQTIETVKTAKATNLFLADVKTYGSQSQALRALDCQTRDEAITMLAAVQKVSVFKRDGRVVVQ